MCCPCKSLPSFLSVKQIGSAAPGCLIYSKRSQSCWCVMKLRWLFTPRWTRYWEWVMSPGISDLSSKCGICWKIDVTSPSWWAWEVENQVLFQHPHSCGWITAMDPFCWAKMTMVYLHHHWPAKSGMSAMILVGFLVFLNHLWHQKCNLL